ncbi:MAG: zinc-ribbon domain-containing protein, partial [Clostridia bacterium]|nr:zinc-ribbon domain-containing protein [Clostridia bacterium]
EIMQQYVTLQKNKSIASEFPHLEKEWNTKRNGNLSPKNFTRGSRKKVWWTCPEGHEYDAVIYARVKGSGCPYCSGRKRITGVNDFATLAPELMKEWIWEENSDIDPTAVSANSDYKAWWKCSSCGYEWQARISLRYTNQSHCPNCRKGISSLPLTREGDHEVVEGEIK